MKRMAPVLPSIVFTCLLAACGGGGSDSPGGPVAPGPSTPPQAPPPPSVNYTGVTQPALLDEPNAGRFAEALAASFYLVESLAEDFLFGLFEDRGAIDESGPGPQGGTLRITGFINENDTGWLQFQFTDFREDGVIFDGRVVQEILVPADRPQPRIRASYHAYRVRFDGEDVQLTGAVDRRVALGGGAFLPATTLVSLLVTDNIRADTLFLDQVEMIREPSILAESGLSLSHVYRAEGALALADEGSVTIVREGPMYFAPDEFDLPDWPWGGRSDRAARGRRVPAAACRAGQRIRRHRAVDRWHRLRPLGARSSR